LGAEGTSNKWAYLSVSTEGWLTFQISPAGGQDFDYAVWGPYPNGFACPSVTLDDPIRCSFAANGGPCFNSTTVGLGAVSASGQTVLPSDVSENSSCTASNDGWTYPIYAYPGEVYVVLFQNYGSNNSSFGFSVNQQAIPSGGTYASLSCQAPLPLPVELVLFTGEHKDRSNILYWSTASEHNNDYFTIEKSIDGVIFTVLGNVQGAGNSFETLYYTLIDDNPYQGVNYYRLIQTDYDGTKRAYKTIAISTEIEIEHTFSNLYPNPTNNAFYFNYGGVDFMNPIEVSVYDASGQMVSKTEFYDFNSSQSMHMEIDNLSNGVYQVVIMQNEHREVKKLSVVK